MPKILIVEDEPDLMEIAAFMMEDAGFTVVQAPNGQRGLELARAESPDVILLDNRLVPDDPNMERIDGPDVARALKGEQHPALIVAMTAYVMPADRKEFEKAGCDMFVSKPIEDYDALIARIREKLRERGIDG